MKQKSYLITRLERSTVVKRVDYEIVASDKKGAVYKLGRMQYAFRETRDEITEDDWKPQNILSIDQAEQ